MRNPAQGLGSRVQEVDDGTPEGPGTPRPQSAPGSDEAGGRLGARTRPPGRLVWWNPEKTDSGKGLRKGGTGNLNPPSFPLRTRTDRKETDRAAVLSEPPESPES